MSPEDYVKAHEDERDARKLSYYGEAEWRFAILSGIVIIIRLLLRRPA